MRQIEMDRTIEVFQLGPFRVLCQPYFREQYHRYTILANGVPIRDQITYPEVEDGWLGLAATQADTPERVDKLRAFRESLDSLTRHKQTKLKPHKGE